jgi:hypothetical protein
MVETKRNVEIIETKRNEMVEIIKIAEFSILLHFNVFLAYVISRLKLYLTHDPSKLTIIPRSDQKWRWESMEWEFMFRPFRFVSTFRFDDFVPGFISNHDRMVNVNEISLIMRVVCD